MTNQTVLDQYPVIDGFTLKASLRCNLTFLSLAVAEYERMRRSNAYRSKTLVVPLSSLTTVPAFDSFEYQFRVEPGSVFWGWSLVTPTANKYSIQITESCTQEPLWSEVVNQPESASSRQNLFSKLLVIPEPGLIDVQICSLNSSAPTGVQLILYGGEPVCSK